MLFESLFFNKITIISECLRQKLKIPRKKSYILSLGANILQKGKQFDKMKLLYIGRLNRRKVEDTIIGYKRFVDKYKEIVSTDYNIIGFGNEDTEKKIRNLIINLELDDYVFFRGRLQYNALNEYLTKCNIGVAYIPKQDYFECQPPTKLFEYLLAGMVVIATNTYENNRIVNEGNGIIIEDRPEEFYRGLVHIYNLRFKYKSENIIKSTSIHSWENICASFRVFLFNYIQK